MKKAFLGILFISLCIGLQAQKTIDPVKWSFDINQTGPEEYELIYIATLDEPWCIYSQESAAGGPIPTSINYTSKNVVPNGKAKESGFKKEGKDEMFDMKLIKYLHHKNYMLKQSVKITDTSKPVTGYVTYMVCDNEKCLPPTDAEFSFTVNILNPAEQKPADLQKSKSKKKAF